VVIEGGATSRPAHRRENHARARWDHPRRAVVHAEPEPQPVHLMLLGGFDLSCGGRSLPLPLGSQRVLAFVAVHKRPLQRLYVAGQLWTDLTDERAAATLRSALWRLHRAGHQLVVATNTHLALDPGVVVDFHEVEALAQSVVEEEVDPRTLDFEAVSLSGELLPDWYDDWIVVERERFRQLRLHALESLCDQLSARGQFAKAVEAGIAAVGSEPLRESAHRSLIGAYLAEGNPSDAIRQYRIYRDLVRTEFGVEPSPQMEDLVSTLRVSPGVSEPRRVVLQADAWD
jgi:DNA-binding SARP family transcriptional activator